MFKISLLNYSIINISDSDSRKTLIFLIFNRDMIPLPYATKENYKVMLYRLADTTLEKVSDFFE